VALLQKTLVRDRLRAAADSRRNHAHLQTTDQAESEAARSGKIGQRETGKRHLRFGWLNRSAYVLVGLDPFPGSDEGSDRCGRGQLYENAVTRPARVVIAGA